MNRCFVRGLLLTYSHERGRARTVQTTKNVERRNRQKERPFDQPIYSVSVLYCIVQQFKYALYLCRWNRRWKAVRHGASFWILCQ